MRKVHGVISLIMIMVPFAAGLYSVITASLQAGIIYAVLLVLAPLFIIYSFCARCSCSREGCGHVLPGKIASFMPDRRGKTYTMLDIAGVIIPFLVLVVYPQPWIYGNAVLAIVFWVFLAAALVDIRLYVCVGCENTDCPLCADLQKGGAQFQ